MSKDVIIKSLAGIGAVAGVLLIVWFTFGHERLPPRPTHFVMIDMASGELVRVSSGNGLTIPMVHPETGEPTLLPVEEHEGWPTDLPDGIPVEELESAFGPQREAGLYVSMRYLGASGFDPGRYSGFVDPESGLVTPVNEDPRNVDRD